MEFRITAENAGKRIDVQTSELSGLTRSQVQKLLEKGFLYVNGGKVKQNYRTKPGDIIHMETSERERDRLVPEDIGIEILYMDDYVMVVNKPAGMVVYPGAGHTGGTLMNAVAYHSRKLASIGGPLRPGVVHRLDKETSGVMVVALDDPAYYGLVEQFRRRTIKRKYTALVYGMLKEDAGEISMKIGRSESDRKKMSTKVRKGKEALTSWDVKERLNGATLIGARLGTGRTHQIRVHFASIGHPVLGDKTYGRQSFIEIKKKKIFFRRQMLHAGLLGFIHPATGEYLEFFAPLPEDMEEKIRDLK